MEEEIIEYIPDTIPDEGIPINANPGINSDQIGGMGVAGWNKIVGDIDSAYSLIEQNESNILLKVSKDDVVNQINISSEGIQIQGSKIEINGDTEVAGSFSITSISDSNLDNIGDGSTYKRVTVNEKTGANRGYNALNTSNRYKEWLTTTDMQSASGLSGQRLEMDSAGLRGYNSGGTKTFEINGDEGDAYFKGEIAASSVIGELSLGTSGSLRVGTTTDYVNIERIGNIPKIQFSDDYAGNGAEMYYDETFTTSKLSIFNIANSLFSDTLEIGVAGGTTMTFRDADVRFDGDMNLQTNDMTGVGSIYADSYRAVGTYIDMIDKVYFHSTIVDSSLNGGSIIVGASGYFASGYYVATSSGGPTTYELGAKKVYIDGNVYYLLVD